MKTKCCAFACGLILAWTGSFALAADEAVQPACGAGCFAGFGGYWGFSELYPPQYLVNELPYYALFPPVYYSLPVPRTYGYSPFAYPPGFTTPPAPPQPVVIPNPYVPQKGTPQPEEKKVAVAPLRIVNSYASQPVAGLASQQ